MIEEGWERSASVMSGNVSGGFLEVGFNLFGEG